MAEEYPKDSSIFPLVLYPDARLNQGSAAVAQVDDDVRKEFDQLAKALYYYDGLGLAGVQIGIMKKICVINYHYIMSKTMGQQNSNTPVYMANPEVIESSSELAALGEGCISIPGVYAKIPRAATVKVKYLDYNGIEQIIEAKDLLATCIQHEIDHTNGVLFIDRLQPLKRKMIIQKYYKLLRQRNYKVD